MSGRAEGATGGPVTLTTAAGAPHRFLVLDSLRGLCACLVALFHLKSNGAIVDSALIRNSWIFVDFFFVLSGFVIGASYRDRLCQGYPVRDFLWLRFMRLYPLHFAMLMVFLAFEIAKPLLGGMGMILTTQPFEPPRSLEQLLSSLLFLQIFGFHDVIVWNGPSWSIAAEMWTYLLMALLLHFGGRHATALTAVVLGAALLVLIAYGPPFLDHTHSMSLVRCLLGFSIGMLSFQAFQRWSGRLPKVRGGSSWAELAAVALCVAFVCLHSEGPSILLAPFVFAIAVLVFAREAGLVSRLLARRPFLFLGTISYSIYMVHIFVQARFIDLALVASKLGLGRLAVVDDTSGRAQKSLGSPENPWLGDLLTFGALGSVILFAWLTYLWIERPARAWSRARLEAWRDARAAERALRQS